MRYLNNAELIFAYTTRSDKQTMLSGAYLIKLIVRKHQLYSVHMGSESRKCHGKQRLLHVNRGLRQEKYEEFGAAGSVWLLRRIDRKTP